MLLLISPKKVYATNRLIEEAVKQNISLTVLDINELKNLNFKVDIAKYSALYVRQAYPYFTEIIEVVQKFREARKYVVDANSIVNGFETSKWFMYQKLKKSEILIPNTKKISSTKSFSYPFILKWVYGFGGNGVFYIENRHDFDANISKHELKEWLVQEYITTNWEYKVITIGFKCVPIILGFKTINGLFKIDIYKYAIFQKSEIQHVAELAERTAEIMGYELAKIDIIEKNGQLFVLEVNRNPGLLPFEPYSRTNVAGEFLSYIRGNCDIMK